MSSERVLYNCWFQQSELKRRHENLTLCIFILNFEKEAERSAIQIGNIGSENPWPCVVCYSFAGFKPKGAENIDWFVTLFGKEFRLEKKRGVWKQDKWTACAASMFGWTIVETCEDKGKSDSYHFRRGSKAHLFK